ncbi:MAG TPA: monovalent cation/H(+) antiporter subunit G [Myxococcaceae bacterium]|nr:monovalent cation/H(+) antiporter subunit G [Myxococcaceae bacterium]
MSLRELLSALLVGLGAAFYAAGTVGLLRFPDALSRVHAVAKADSAGLGLTVLGLLLQVDSVFTALKLLFVWGLALVASASGAQLVARAAVCEEREGSRK